MIQNFVLFHEIWNITETFFITENVAGWIYFVSDFLFISIFAILPFCVDRNREGIYMHMDGERITLWNPSNIVYNDKLRLKSEMQTKIKYVNHNAFGMRSDGVAWCYQVAAYMRINKINWHKIQTIINEMCGCWKNGWKYAARMYHILKYIYTVRLVRLWMQKLVQRKYIVCWHWQKQ